MTAGVRIPLQVGLAALRNAIRANVFGWGATVGWIVGVFIAPHALPELPETLAIVVWLIALLASSAAAMYFLALASTARELVKSEAPSDLVLAGDRIRVEGGPLDGKMVMWSAIDPGGCEVVESAAAERAGLRGMAVKIATLGRATAKRRPVFTLRIRSRQGETVELARSDDPEEVESFRELARTIAAIAGEESDAAPAAPDIPAGPALLTCTSCNAALAPVDAERVDCHHCKTTVVIPGELRERMRAPEVAARGPAVQRRMQRLLARPGWTRAAGWLRWGTRAMRVVWPIAIAGVIALMIVHWPDDGHYPTLRIAEGYPSAFRRDLLPALGVIVAVIVVVATLVAAILAGRRAVRVVSLRLGAIPPATAGAPATCRQCGAPLPAVANQVVTRCVYCTADNVMALDLRIAARRTRGQATSLDEATRHRRRARLRVLVAFALSTVAVVVIAREILWSLRLAARQPESSLGCMLCSTAELRNDDHRRMIAIVDGDRTVRKAIPAGALVKIECKTRCRIEAAGGAHTLGRRHDRLVVRDGTIVRE